MRIFLTGLLGFATALFASPAVLVEADIDTVLKIKYVGTNPSGSAPTLTVGGKRIGIFSKTTGGSGSIGIMGTTSGIAAFVGSGDAGVMGVAAAMGVYGEGASIGLRGVSAYYGTGVVGEVGHGYGVGVSGKGQIAGVKGITTNEYGYAIYGHVEDDGIYAGYFDGDVEVVGDLYYGSDASLKQNVRDIGKGLQAILALSPKAYEMKPGALGREKPSPGTKFGLIAQEVESVLPEVVRVVKTPAKMNSAGNYEHTSSSREEFRSVNYTGMIPILIKAMQEQQALIEALQAEVAALKK